MFNTVGRQIHFQPCNDVLGCNRDFSGRHRSTDAVLEGVYASNLCVVGVGAFGGRDDAQGGHRLAVFRPGHILRKLVAISVGSCHLDVHAVARCGGGGGEVRCHRDRLTVQDGDGNTVRDVETCTADAVGFNAPFTDRGRFPAHGVKKQLGRDVARLTGFDVDLEPRQFLRRNLVVIRVKQFGGEIDGEIRGDFNHCTGRPKRVIGHGFNGHRVEHTVVNRDVDGNAEVGVGIAVGRREHVGQVRGVIRREGRCITGQDLKEIRGVGNGRVVKRPVGFGNRPLVTLGVNGENFRFQGVIGRDVKVLPCRNFVVYGDAEGLGLSSLHIDDDLGEFRLIPSLKDL